MTDNRDRMYPMERYRTVLTHEIIDSDGSRHQIEEPIVCNYCLTRMDIAMGGRRGAVVVNEMLERLSEYLLKQVEEREAIK